MFQSFLFCLAFTTGWSSSGSLPFIQCFILFSQFILVCFIICKNEIMISWPPWVRVWGWASYRFLPFTIFFLACPFVSQVISFIYDVQVRGVVSMFTRPLILSLCGVVCEHLLPCCVVVTAGWVVSCTDTYYVYPAFAPLLADITCPIFLFRKYCCFLSLFCFFFTMHSFFFIFGLLAISYPLVSLPD